MIRISRRTFAVTAVSATVSAMLVAGSHALAGAPARSTPPLLAGLQYDPSQVNDSLCNSLGGAEPAPTITALPGGGASYNYTVDGVSVSYPVPPQGFSPLAATDQQLSEYGFPPRPTDP